MKNRKRLLVSTDNDITDQKIMQGLNTSTMPSHTNMVLTS